MRLTKQTNYAIRILMYCTANQGRLSHISEIAKAYNVSELFLFKILRILVGQDLIQTVRGRNGGIMLKKDPAKITVAEVVKITEENFNMAECFEEMDISCPLVDSCGLHSVLNKALKAFFEILDKTTIADLQRDNFRTKLGISEENLNSE